MWHHCSGIYTGCMLHSALSSSWWRSCTDVWMARHRPTWHRSFNVADDADIGSRQRLHSGLMSAVLVPSTRRVTLGDRSFTVAATRTWNNLSTHVRSASSLTMFRRRLKAELFVRSFDWQLMLHLSADLTNCDSFDCVTCSCSPFGRIIT